MSFNKYSGDDDPSSLEHAAINTTNEVVLTLFTLLVVRKHNRMSKFKNLAQNFLTITHTKTTTDEISGFSILCLSLSVSYISVSSFFCPANCFMNSDRPA